MARKPRWNGPEPVDAVWPGDRYEVRCTFPPPDYATSDFYHYAEFAYEAARRIRDAGLARQVQVVRMRDNTVLFDLMTSQEAPLDAW
ncbi:hypothetical protein [Microtetraspora sp. NBRC 13810]|uniref:hypothetical protein n=1 Tax=Microtetraspora sp. NBRC 13810 TaxID=3030990 RepID=UPI002556AF65|nr:hypothetical protein [Microtetraspora sp. NBRC 13810]